MGTNKQYYVVEFLDENTVEAVPTTWVNVAEQICYWPPNNSTSLAKKCSFPLPSWTQCKIKFAIKGAIGKTNSNLK